MADCASNSTKRRVLPLVDLAEEVHDDIRDARKREKGTE